MSGRDMSGEGHFDEALMEIRGKCYCTKGNYIDIEDKSLVFWQQQKHSCNCVYVLTFVKGRTCEQYDQMLD